MRYPQTEQMQRERRTMIEVLETSPDDSDNPYLGFVLHLADHLGIDVGAATDLLDDYLDYLDRAALPGTPTP